MFKLEIETDNAAFFDHDGNPDAGAEIARILRIVAYNIENGSRGMRLHDLNGNDVGRARLID